jgi:hypothetical protein
MSDEAPPIAQENLPILKERLENAHDFGGGLKGGRKKERKKGRKGT